MAGIRIAVVTRIARRAGRIGTRGRGEDEGNETQHYEGTDPAGHRASTRLSGDSLATPTCGVLAVWFRAFLRHRRAILRHLGTSSEDL